MRDGRRGGFTYTELLVAVLLVAIAASWGLAAWSISSRAPANKRATEMAVYIATQELERMKARKYMGMSDTPVGSPIVTYYDRYGAPAAGNTAAPRGFQARSWVMPMVDRNGVADSEDLREIKVEVYDNGGGRMYERAQTLLAFGGV